MQLNTGLKVLLSSAADHAAPKTKADVQVALRETQGAFPGGDPKQTRTSHKEQLTYEQDEMMWMEAAQMVGSSR